LAALKYGARSLPYLEVAELWAEHMQQLGIIVPEKGAKEYLDNGFCTDGGISGHLQIIQVLVFLHSILNDYFGDELRMSCV
jgi:hypothetical protein